MHIRGFVRLILTELVGMNARDTAERTYMLRFHENRAETAHCVTGGPSRFLNLFLGSSFGPIVGRKILKQNTGTAQDPSSNPKKTTVLCNGA